MCYTLFYFYSILTVCNYDKLIVWKKKKKHRCVVHILLFRECHFKTTEKLRVQQRWTVWPGMFTAPKNVFRKNLITVKLTAFSESKNVMLRQSTVFWWKRRSRRFYTNLTGWQLSLASLDFQRLGYTLVK